MVHRCVRRLRFAARKRIADCLTNCARLRCYPRSCDCQTRCNRWAGIFYHLLESLRLQAEWICEIDGVPVRESVSVQPTREPDGVFLREPAARRTWYRFSLKM